jgi:Zn-dependent M28 family amino/carboxypeptidase
MRKLNTLLLIISLSVGCSQENKSDKYAESIDSNDLKDLLSIYSSDDFEGRQTGQKGDRIAANFLRDFYIANQIEPAQNTIDYFQPYQLNLPGEMYTINYSFPETLRGYDRYAEGENFVDTQNVASIIEGEIYPESYIIITGHLDHVGINGDEVYNGADDNGSGTVSILEIAQAFKLAELDGNRPKRSIVFLHVSGEEEGLLGSEYYVNNSLYPLGNTFVNLNLDMIGRTDPNRGYEDDNYIYSIGSDRISKELKKISERVNKRTENLKLDYSFDIPNDPNDFYERSDHFNFAKNDIPVIFFFSGTHEDYHGPGDTYDKIRYDLLTKRARLIFHTAWELANMDERIQVDQNKG